MAIDRAILVTGAGSGIGRAVAELLIAGGSPVIAVDRDEAALDRLAADCPANLHCETLDIAQDEAVGPALDRGVAALGPLGGVVNCAGIGWDVPALDTAAADFRALLDVNLVGGFVVAREAAKRMAPVGGGSIVIISSVSGIRGNAGRAAYAASKGGLDALTRVLAGEWAAHGVRVNAVAPGPIDTPLAARVHTAAIRRQWCANVPMRRYGTTGEVARAVLFLLDDQQSSYVTGQTLCVDGGFVSAGLRGGGDDD